MQTITKPSTQPVMKHAYRALWKNGGVHKTVIYGGYENGCHLIIEGTTTYRAYRTSPEDKEPEFEFDSTQVVR